MIKLTAVFDADVLSADFPDGHTESVVLGDWAELTIGNVRLVRAPDGRVVAVEVEEIVHA